MKTYMVYLKDGTYFEIKTGGFVYYKRTKAIRFLNEPFDEKADPEQEVDSSKFLVMPEVSAITPIVSSSKKRLVIYLKNNIKMTVGASRFVVSTSDYPVKFFDSEDNQILDIYVSSPEVIGIFPNE